MPAGSFFEGAAHAAEIPGIFLALEPLGQVLGPENPGIVRQPAQGIGACVGVDQLPGRRHSDGKVVEGEVLRILDEMKEVRVAAAELFGAVDPEGVIPNDPATAGEA
jgi:hypothetical protein